MGTVVLGKLESGSISKGQQLVMMPNKVRINNVLFSFRFSLENFSKKPGLFKSLGISTKINLTFKIQDYIY